MAGEEKGPNTIPAPRGAMRRPVIGQIKWLSTARSPRCIELVAPPGPLGAGSRLDAVKDLFLIFVGLRAPAGDPDGGSGGEPTAILRVS